MQYFGGKFHLRIEIAQFLEELRKPNQLYLEPFVGAGWVLSEMSGNRAATDINPHLIAMWKALQITQSELNEYQNRYADVVIKPDLKDINQFQFYKANQIIEIGKQATQDKIKEIRRLLK